MINDVIQSTLEHQPWKICKNFVHEHGMKLSYCQAWKIKENAKDKIYGLPWNYYKLLLWMCGRVVQMNPRSIVYLTYSSDCHFEQLFITHEVSIQGFLLGYRLSLQLIHLT